MRGEPSTRGPSTGDIIGSGARPPLFEQGFAAELWNRTRAVVVDHHHRVAEAVENGGQLVAIGSQLRRSFPSGRPASKSGERAGRRSRHGRGPAGGRRSCRKRVIGLGNAMRLRRPVITEGDPDSDQGAVGIAINAARRHRAQVSIAERITTGRSNGRPRPDLLAFVADRRSDDRDFAALQVPGGARTDQRLVEPPGRACSRGRWQPGSRGNQVAVGIEIPGGVTLAVGSLSSARVDVGLADRSARRTVRPTASSVERSFSTSWLLSVMKV